MVDNILIGLNDSSTTAELKSAFGAPNVTHDGDFASVIASGIYGWQSLNWDPEVNIPTFTTYCANITSDKVLYPETNDLTSTVQDLLTKGGYGSEVSTLTTPMLNWIGWLGPNELDNCDDVDQDSCYSTYNVTFYEDTNIETASWRSWPYQVRNFLHED